MLVEEVKKTIYSKNNHNSEVVKFILTDSGWFQEYYEVEKREIGYECTCNLYPITDNQTIVELERALKK